MTFIVKFALIGHFYLFDFFVYFNFEQQEFFSEMFLIFFLNTLVKETFSRSKICKFFWMNFHELKKIVESYKKLSPTKEILRTVFRKNFKKFLSKIYRISLIKRGH